MITSDFKSAIRSILHNKIPSIISILGLGIGLGCIIVLTALIIHERSFDKFIPDHRNVYRVLFGNTTYTQYPFAEAIAGEIPEIKEYFRYYQTSSVQLRNQKNEMIRDQNFGFADTSLFRILGIEFIFGNAAASSQEIAISGETAMKYFGNLSPLGAILQVKFPEGFVDLSVSGVYKDFPANSSLHPLFIADLKLSVKMIAQFQRNLGAYGNDRPLTLDWNISELLTYVVLEKNADTTDFSKKTDKYKEFLNRQNIDDIHYRLQPVTDIYLGSQGIQRPITMRQGNPEELKYYEAIALLILIISVANYILLARASVSDRVHELGTRKVFGASFAKIRGMIILESNIIVILSLIPATFVIDYGMTFINETLNKTITGRVFLSPQLWFILIMVVVFTGTIAGWLIGFRYSRMPALKLISGKNPGTGGFSRWNYSFLVIHFTIYIMLVSGVISVRKQIKFSMSGYKGFNPENVIITGLNTDQLKNSFLTMCDEMKKVPGVLYAAGGSYIPPLGYVLPVNLRLSEGENIRFDGLIMGEGMTELLGIEVIEGSSFGPYKPGPPEILINESAATEHKVKAGDNILVFKVRGIIRDFNVHSLHSLIEPLVILQQNPESMAVIAIKTDGKNDESIRNRLKELYNTISPDEIFETEYLTDQFDNFYASESNQLRIISAFSLLATILAIMGLFGISLISISKRNKEIGIRKVNGASVTEVLFMLNSEFVKWVIVAVIISVPASIWLLTTWMDRFAYKTELSWWIFAFASISAIIIAILTVSWQSSKAATRNPVMVMRYE